MGSQILIFLYCSTIAEGKKQKTKQQFKYMYTSNKLSKLISLQLSYFSMFPSPSHFNPLPQHLPPKLSCPLSTLPPPYFPAVRESLVADHSWPTDWVCSRSGDGMSWWFWPSPPQPGCCPYMQKTFLTSRLGPQTQFVCTSQTVDNPKKRSNDHSDIKLSYFPPHRKSMKSLKKLALRLITLATIQAHLIVCSLRDNKHTV